METQKGVNKDKNKKIEYKNKKYFINLLVLNKFFRLIVYF